MSPKQAAKWNIFVSLFFAVAIIVSSWLLRDTEYGQFSMFVLIAIWIVPYTWLSAQTGKDNSTK